MIPTLIFLLIVILLGVALYLYLKQKQNKFIFPDIYYENTQSLNRATGELKKVRHQNNSHEFLLLIGLSATSGILIASITLVMYLLPDLELLGFFLLWFSQVVQFILIIPATFIVFILFSLSYKKIHFIFRVGIPLIFNILGASALSISYWVMRLPDQHLTQQYTATIKNETIIPWKHWDGYNGYAYRVALHIQNDSQETNSKLSIRIDTTEDYWGPLGDSDVSDIPLGESDITVIIPIDQFDYLNEFDQRCNFTSVTEPLHLFYSAGHPNYKKSIILDSNMSQQLLQLACKSKP